MKKRMINPMMKKQKKLKKLNANNRSEDENEIKSFVKITIIIFILIGAIYGITEQ